MEPTKQSNEEDQDKLMESLYNESYIRKLNIINQNECLKLQSNINTKKLIPFDLKKNEKTIKMKNTINISGGNFCFPLKENYIPIREKSFFCRYYGEEKIYDMQKKLNKRNKIDIQDDLILNLIIIIAAKNSKNLKELKNTLKLYLNFNEISRKLVSKRLKKIYDRLHFLGIVNNKNKFYHMSCLKTEDKNYENLINTNKQLYCPICWKYDCSLHPFEVKLFDSAQSYNALEYLNSYKNMNETAYKILTKDSNINMSNELLKTVFTNCRDYNNIINDKFNHFCNFINLFNDSDNYEQFLLENKNKISLNCNKLCFYNFLTINYSLRNKIFEEFNKKLPNVYEIYLSKLIQIFKYDPCSISKCFKLISLFSDSFLNNKNNGICECYVIFLRLISNDFSIKKTINKDIIDLFFKEKSFDKRKALHSNMIKNISQNIKNNNIVPYQPCYHLGNEVCNDKCQCSKRGFCEKYCTCNKQLCKLRWTGCHCKGPCNSSLCPCFANFRECDSELCQNCKLKGNSICKNLQLQKSTNLKLAVADSCIAGWGLFSKKDYHKDELLGEYVGELIGINDLNERSEYMDMENATYMFTLNDEYTVDSKTMGNIMRFANHSKLNANAYTKIIFANGKHRICLYANETICKHNEIFFNYDGQNLLCDKFDWINDKNIENIIQKANPKSNINNKHNKKLRKISKKNSLFINHKKKRDEIDSIDDDKYKGYIDTFDLFQNDFTHNKNYYNSFKNQCIINFNNDQFVNSNEFFLKYFPRVINNICKFNKNSIKTNPYDYSKRFKNIEHCPFSKIYDFKGYEEEKNKNDIILFDDKAEKILKNNYYNKDEFIQSENTKISPSFFDCILTKIKTEKENEEFKPNNI